MKQGLFHILGGLPPPRPLGLGTATPQNPTQLLHFGDESGGPAGVIAKTVGNRGAEQGTGS